MEHRKLGNLIGTPSLLGYGCMRFPTKEDNTIDYEKTEQLIDYAYNHGINYFDTAYPYHRKESEIVLGKIMKKYDRSTFYLVTKLPCWLVEKEEDVLTLFNEQLEKLQTDYIDFYLVHALDIARWDNVKKTNTLKVLEQLKSEGKIKNLGFSFHDEYEIFEQIINEHKFDFCQIQLNYIDTNYQAGLKGVELCRQKNLPIMIMEPVKGGSLAKVPTDADETFKSINPDWSAARWAFQYLINIDQVQTILSGMTTMEQLQDNINTFENGRKLTKQEEDAITQAADIFSKRVKVNCTGCKYCMPCPMGVDIPRNFTIYNDISKFDNLKEGKVFYNLMNENKRACKCVACGACIKECPQNIDIPKRLKEFSDLMK